MELTDSIHEYRYVKVIGHCKNCGNDIYKCESRLNFEGLLEKIIRSESKIENL